MIYFLIQVTSQEAFRERLETQHLVVVGNLPCFNATACWESNPQECWSGLGATAAVHGALYTVGLSEAKQFHVIVTQFGWCVFEPNECNCILFSNFWGYQTKTSLKPFVWVGALTNALELKNWLAALTRRLVGNNSSRWHIRKLKRITFIHLPKRDENTPCS